MAPLGICCLPTELPRESPDKTPRKCPKQYRVIQVLPPDRKHPLLIDLKFSKNSGMIVLSRAINFGRQCHFKIWLDCHKFKKIPCLIMPMSTKCQKNKNKMIINVIQHDDDIYDCFTMEHFRLRQRMTLTIKIYCSRLYITL
jgi:hypothetical protein